jgi:hypothetical protein
MFDAAIEIAIAAFMTMDHPSDVARALARAGVEPWLVQRLTVFVPAAFGRSLFRGRVASMSSTLTDPSGTRPLDDDPVWSAALERSNRATRAEMDRIATRSSIVASVEAMLSGGAELGRLSLGGIALQEPLLPLGAGHGGIPSPRTAFHDFVRGRLRGPRRRKGA